MSIPSTVKPSAIAKDRQTTQRPSPWLLGLVVVAVAFPGASASAEVFDDFEDPTRSSQLWTQEVQFGTGGATYAAGKATLVITPSGAHGLCNLASVRSFTLQPGRVLEFSADLLSSNGDGALARLGFTLLDGSAGYILQVDQDTVAFSKRPSPLQLFHLANDQPTDVTNVKLVVSMTGLGSSVLLQIKILNNEQGGAVLYQRDIWDTAGLDAMVRGTDSPAASLVGMPGRFRLGLYHDNAAVFDPVVGIGPQSTAEVVFDNAEVREYDAPILDISPAALLGWPPRTLEGQIVVGSSSPEGPWTPWPEPIFKRHGTPCLAVPTTATQQYFQLTPGTQFSDDFSHSWGPFTSRNPWTPWFGNPADASRFDFTVTDGVFRIAAPGQPQDGQVMVFHPGPVAAVGDFWASVDLLDWASSQESALGLAGRVQGGPTGVNNMYLGSVRMNPAAASGRLYFFNGASDIPASSVFNVSRDSGYRLEFSAVGSELTLRLVTLASPSIVVAEGRLQDSKFAQGPVALWVNTRGTSGYARTLDNFFVTGTKP